MIDAATDHQADGLRAYVPQTTPFTCGPAAGLMALRLAGVPTTTCWIDELRIWREANSIFMGKGQAGCEPDGLAAALARRGACVRLWERETTGLFDAWTRSPDARLILGELREADRAEAAKAGVERLDAPFSRQILDKHLSEGWVPVVLARDGRTLHWVTVRKIEDGRVEVLDPYVTGAPRDRQAAPKIYSLSAADVLRFFTHRRGKAHAIIFIRNQEPFFPGVSLENQSNTGSVDPLRQRSGPST